LLDNFLGKGLITRQVDKWRIHRRILQPAFHYHVLEKFVETFSECADRLVNKLLEKNEEDINITVFVNNTVYDILIGMYHRSSVFIKIIMINVRQMRKISSLYRKIIIIKLRITIYFYHSIFKSRAYLFILFAKCSIEKLTDNEIV
jgi:hypothetical protein